MRVKKVNKLRDDIKIWAEIVKTFLQYGIGAGIIIFTILEIFIFLFPAARNVPCFKELLIYFDMKFLKVLSLGLLASTAIDLGHMLFTPELDEAVNPIITATAALILTMLSKEEFSLEDSICIGMLVVIIGGLFWVKNRYFKNSIPIGGGSCQHEVEAYQICLESRCKEVVKVEPKDHGDHSDTISKYY